MYISVSYTHLDLISYDDFDLQCLKKDGALKKGSNLSEVYGDSHFVLATSDTDSTWKIGDTVQIGDETLTISGLLKNDPFSAVSYTHLDVYKRQRICLWDFLLR